MKKIAVGVFGIVILVSGLISLRSGVLKAGELVTESSILETSTTEVLQESEGSIESSETVVEEDDGGAEIPVTEEVSEETSTIESNEGENNSSETASSESGLAESSTDASSSAASSNSSSSSSSSTVPSSSSTTGSTSSTKPSSSTSSSSSTKPSISTSNSTPTTGTIPSESATQPSTSQTAPKNPGTSASSAASTSTAETPTITTPDDTSVQSQSIVTPTVPEAFSETSTLNLPSELKTAEVAQSDLKGFELPLLSSFDQPAQGVVIYEGIKRLGTEQTPEYSVQQLANDLYQQLFALETSGTPKEASEDITVGSLIYQKTESQTVLLGVYIGDDYYLTVDDVEIDDEELEAEVEETNMTTIETSDESEAIEEADEKNKQRQVVIEPLALDEDLLVQELPEAALTDYGQQVLEEYPAAMNFTENEGAKNFIEKIAEDARTLGQEYDVFASVMIAQALLESGSGTSSLSLAPNYNLFGIKGTYQGQSISMATQEDRGNGELYSINSAFRKYPNYAASLGDYVELLRGGISGNTRYYEKTWRSKAKNYLRTTTALTGTYATDTSYARKLNSIIALYHLTQYDQPKSEENSGVFIKGKEEIPEEYRNLMKYPDYNGVDYNTSGSYPVGQCTWYAYNRVKQLGKTVDDYMGNGGEWAVKGKALGYEVSQKPKVGWLISFRPGTAGSDPRYGHVAFVEAVRPEGILISEGNVYGGTVISYRVIDTSLATSDLVSYIKAK